MVNLSRDVKTLLGVEQKESSEAHSCQFLICGTAHLRYHKQASLAHFCSRDMQLLAACVSYRKWRACCNWLSKASREIQLCESSYESEENFLARVQATLKPTKETRKDHPTAW